MAINIYDVPDGEMKSEAFAVSANSQVLPVHEARVSAVPFNRRWPGHQRTIDQTELAYFAALEADEPVEIRITAEKPFDNVTIRPLSRSIDAIVDGSSIVFTVTEVGGYTVELDDFHNAFHLFVDPIRTYDVDPNDDNTLYFGPGIHDAGLIRLESDQTVFIDAGAVVYATIHAANASNISVKGRGILDNSKNVEEILFKVDDPGPRNFDVRNSRREDTIKLVNVKRAEIDGITIRNSLKYNISTFGCENIVVDNVKIIGCWRYNSDGIDLHNSSHCVIRNCFVRTYDDSICVKGHHNSPPVCPHCGEGHQDLPDLCQDILVENCTVWCDWGKSLEMGAETCARKMHNITFRDCDLIRNSFAAMDIENVDYGEVFDILFEDIRVEYDPISQPWRLQLSDEDAYVIDPDSDYMPRLITSKIIQHPEYSAGKPQRGRNHDVVFRQIKVFANRMPPSSLSGYDREHQIADFKISDLSLNGKSVTTLDSANIDIGDFVEDISVE